MHAHPDSAPARLMAEDLHALFSAQHRASRQQVDVPLEARLDRLQRIAHLMDTHEAELGAAVAADFGVRSLKLTEVADWLLLRAMLAQTRRSLRRWMKPQKVATPLYLKPSRAYLLRQPLGVVGVVSPWNYPLQLALGPVITALAAGNRVMLKPSELTPRTSALLAQLVERHFSPEELVVVEGDAALAAAFCALPFDHLVFTGSTATGRQVAQAAAANLTPTTLELGGKSPCLIDASCDLDSAALKIAHGKLLNAGQTCIAPDYMLLPRGLEGRFTEAYTRAVGRLFPGIPNHPDYAAIINERHWQRLHHWLDEAREAGARVHEVRPGPATAAPAASRQMRPTLVFDARPGMALMDEEIFGPILPVVPYASLDEAIAYINARPRPLALYWFGQDSASQERVLARTVSGGVTLNDTLMHVAHENLPFGGVGDSGWGAYHGETGFLRFTQQKPVLLSSCWARTDLFYPPYGRRFSQVMGLLRRLL